MLLSKVVAAASFLIVTINVIWAMPRPGIIRERHVIHAPIKVRVIHHYKIKKIPLIIKKHLHYYKHQEDIHHRPKPVVEEHISDIYHHQQKPVVEEHGNDIYHHQHDDDDDQYQFHFQHQDDHLHFESPHAPHHQNNHYDVHEDDYEEHEQSKEEDDEDYEYE